MVPTDDGAGRREVVGTAAPPGVIAALAFLPRGDSAAVPPASGKVGPVNVATRSRLATAASDGIAAAISAADANRSRGSFSSALCTATTSAVGRSGRAICSGGGGICRCWVTSAM